jgi:hypothetical protein
MGAGFRVPVERVVKVERSERFEYRPWLLPRCLSLSKATRFERRFKCERRNCLFAGLVKNKGNIDTLIKLCGKFAVPGSA